MLAPQHLLSLEAFEQAPTYIGAQDAAARGGLGIGHRTDIQCGLVRLRRAWAFGLKGLRAITPKKMRITMPSTAQSRCIK